MAIFEAGSFRDPQARVIDSDGAIYRLLSPRAGAEWRALASSSFLASSVAAGRIVATEEVPPSLAPPALRQIATDGSVLLRHERVPFVSYPYEWCFGMLKDAALLQLELLAGALDEGFTMKDATPFNVQWRGVEPSFIDIGSFERLADGEPWFGYRQFCNLFLNPLLLQARKGIAFHPWLRGALDGIEPESLLALMRPRDVLRPGIFLHVFLQAKLSRRYAASTTDVTKEVAREGFNKAMLRGNVARLERWVRRLEWRPPRSEWSEYVSEHSYRGEDLERKMAFVAAAASRRRRRWAWDLGANTGMFSRLVADSADHVIALDVDHLSVERLYASLRRDGERKILPLVMDLSQPSPAIGWRNRERKSLQERINADFVLCLALFHHLVLARNVPVAEVVEWLHGFGSEVVLEVAHRDDPMARRLLLNKKETHDDYDLSRVEEELGRRFSILARQTLSSGHRTLYHLEPRGGGAREVAR